MAAGLALRKSANLSNAEGHLCPNQPPMLMCLMMDQLDAKNLGRDEGQEHAIDAQLSKGQLRLDARSQRHRLPREGFPTSLGVSLLLPPSPVLGDVK